MIERELPPESLNPNIASLGRRALAFLLDALILAIPCAIGVQLIPVIGGLAVLFFYAPVLEASELRATLGKHLVGIQVADPMGRRISFKAAFLRNLLKYATFSFFFIGFVFAFFTKRKQTLHDLLADTLVVYGRSDLAVGDAWMESVKKIFRFDGSPFAAKNGGSAVAQLERLQVLREKGALTEDEFQREKARILSAQE